MIPRGDGEAVADAFLAFVIAEVTSIYAEVEKSEKADGREKHDDEKEGEGWCVWEMIVVAVGLP